MLISLLVALLPIFTHSEFLVTRHLLSPLPTSFSFSLDVTTTFPRSLASTPQVTILIGSCDLQTSTLTTTFTLKIIFLSSNNSGVSYSLDFTSDRTLYFVELNIVANTQANIQCGVVQYIPGSTLKYRRVLDLGKRTILQYTPQQGIMLSRCKLAWGLVFDDKCQLATNSSVSYLVVGVRFYSGTFASNFYLPTFKDSALLMENYVTDETNLIAYFPGQVGAPIATAQFHNMKFGTNNFLLCSCKLSRGMAIIPNFCFYLLVLPSYQCPQSWYLQYSPVNNLPIQCAQCHWSCKSCRPSPFGQDQSTQNDCLTCPSSRVLQQEMVDGVGSGVGQCLCPSGRLNDTQDLRCLPCQSECVTYWLRAMQTTESVLILLSFSQKPLSMDIPIRDNIRIGFNNKDSGGDFDIQKDSATENYRIHVPSTNPVVSECILWCKITVRFIDRTKVRFQKKSLLNDQQSVQLTEVTFRTSLSVSAIAKATSQISSAMFAGGAGKFVRVLFQLQQLIQYHKYANITMPANFLQLLQDLTGFQYINVFDIASIDLYETVGDVFPTELDYVGDIRTIYYDRGAFFMKNIVQAIGSILVIAVLNGMVYGLARVVPWGFGKTLQKHYQLRWLNILNDSVEAMILPIIFFSGHQMPYLTANTDIYNSLIMFLLYAYLLAHPFLTCLYVHEHHKDPQLKQHLQDLLMDCSSQQHFSYFLYLLNYYRKVLVACFLTPEIPGDTQIFLIFLINLIFLLMLVYTTYQKYFQSKLKIVLKLVFNSCIVFMDFGLVFLRRTYEVGEMLKFLAFVASVPLILEAMVRIGELIYLLVKLGIERKKQSQQEEQGQLRQESDTKKETERPKSQAVKQDQNDQFNFDASELSVCASSIFGSRVEESKQNIFNIQNIECIEIKSEQVQRHYQESQLEEIVIHDTTERDLKVRDDNQGSAKKLLPEIEDDLEEGSNIQIKIIPQSELPKPESPKIFIVKFDQDT